MPIRTPNHGYRLFAQGEMPWDHREEFRQLDIEAPIVRPDAEKSTFEPRVNALFVAYEGPVYRGDGASWIQIGDLAGGGGGTGDPTLTEGISATYSHAGPHHQGTYHTVDAVTGQAWGIAFAATDGLYIDSCVVDVDLTTSTRDVLDIEFYQVDSRTTQVISTPSTPVATTTTPPLSGGPERVDLGFTVPTGDGYTEYALAVRLTGDVNGNHLAPRLQNPWTGWDNYSDPDFNLLQGGRLNSPTNSEYHQLYAYLFDIAYGTPTTKVNSPWSHDVEEIYMRPRPPEEEFDNVSPRSLWFDTSGT